MKKYEEISVGIEAAKTEKATKIIQRKKKSSETKNLIKGGKMYNRK